MNEHVALTHKGRGGQAVGDQLRVVVKVARLSAPRTGNAVLLCNCTVEPRFILVEQ